MDVRLTLDPFKTPSVFTDKRALSLRRNWLKRFGINLSGRTGGTQARTHTCAHRKDTRTQCKRSIQILALYSHAHTHTHTQKRHRQRSNQKNTPTNAEKY